MTPHILLAFALSILAIGVILAKAQVYLDVNLLFTQNLLNIEGNVSILAPRFRVYQFCTAFKPKIRFDDAIFRRRPKYTLLLKHLLRKVKVKNVAGSLTVGTGDAASTALTCGNLYALLNTASAILMRLRVVESLPSISVNADFRNPTLLLKLSVMLQISIADIIAAVWKIVVQRDHA